MAPGTNSGGGRVLQAIRNGDYFLAAGLFAVIIVLILPVPKMLMDVLLTASIGLAILVLLVIVYVREPVQFSVFPTVLLIATLYRLALNVASTRLILLEADAGKVIASFGNFVVGGNYVVGGVVFLILVIVNFVVITKGSGRIAEVAARFTLDAMPGKQMAIDAELNAGIIDEAKATERRRMIQVEADFYGKMDGASKFVRGDAVAGILITLINIVAGFAIGMMQRGMSLQDSLRQYTLLSIGDGLVSQIPALVLSLAAGLLITRASGSQNMGSSLVRQLSFYPRALAILSGILVVLAILPGMPKLPFLALALLCGGLAFQLKKSKLDATRFEKLLDEAEVTVDQSGVALPSSVGESAPAAGGGEAAAATPGAPVKSSTVTDDELRKMVDVDELCVELGYALLRLADEEKGGDLIHRITGLRKSFAKEMGVVLPSVAVRDNFELEANDYCFLLRGKPVARGRVLPNRSLAMNVSGSSRDIPGEKTKEPVFGLDAIWVDENGRKTAEMNGYTVVDAVSVLCTHLTEVFRTHAHEIINRQSVQAQLDHLKQSHPALMDELFPDLVSVGLIQNVLKNLLKEGVSIRNLTLILECMGDMAPHSKNPNDLSEYARRRLAPYIIQDFEYKTGKLKAVTLDPKLEEYLITRVQRSQFEVGLTLDPQTAHDILERLSGLMREMMDEGLTPVILTMSELRLPFKRFFEASMSRLAVISYQEIPAETEIENYGVVSSPNVSQRQELEAIA
ncbi:MAG: flagellar biosynthesis protein FlhA [Puniceicoccaceae bacterium]